MWVTHWKSWGEHYRQQRQTLDNDLLREESRSDKTNNSSFQFPSLQKSLISSSLEPVELRKSPFSFSIKQLSSVFVVIFIILYLPPFFLHIKSLRAVYYYSQRPTTLPSFRKCLFVLCEVWSWHALCCRWLEAVDVVVLTNGFNELQTNNQQSQ